VPVCKNCAMVRLILWKKTINTDEIWNCVYKQVVCSIFIISTMNSECLIFSLKNYVIKEFEKYTFQKKYSLESSAFWDIILSSPLQAVLAICFFEISCLAYFSTLRVKAKYTSEESVEFQRIIRYFIPNDRTLHNHSCENLISYFSIAFFTLFSHS
jgi:hypothetical protein